MRGPGCCRIPGDRAPTFRSMKLRPVLLLVACSLLGFAAPASAALQFGAPTQLPHGDPDGTPWYLGAEPSIGFDPNGDHHVYVTAPQRIPSVLGQNGGPGIGYWASDDGGASWPRS